MLSTGNHGKHRTRLSPLHNLQKGFGHLSKVLCFHRLLRFFLSRIVHHVHHTLRKLANAIYKDFLVVKIEKESVENV